VQGVFICDVTSHSRGSSSAATAAVPSSGKSRSSGIVYYHCTGYRGKCGDPYVRHEVIEAKFFQVLGRIALDDEVCENGSPHWTISAPG
jgi:hypothetical protein